MGYCFDCYRVIFRPSKNTDPITKEVKCTVGSPISVLGIETKRLMLHRKIIAVCSEILRKQINTLCGQKVESLKLNLVVSGGIYSKHLASKF